MAPAKASKKQKKRPRDEYSLADLNTLGRDLLSSRAHINNLPLLLAFVSPSSSPSHALEALLSLQSFFTPLLHELPPSSSKLPFDQPPVDDPELIYRTWVRSKFDEFVKLLIDFCLCPDSEETLSDVVLDALMELVKLGKGGRFQSSIYHKLLHSIVHSSVGVDFLLESLASKYFKFLDVRYFTYISMKKLSDTLEAKDVSVIKTVSLDGSNGENHSRTSLEISIHNIHFILSQISPLEALDDPSCHEMWVGSGDPEDHLQPVDGKDVKKSNSNALSSVGMAKNMKQKFTKAWISFLRLPLPLDVYKEVLVSLHQMVIPHLSNPIILCDFLTKSYDIGGVTSVMALSSLYMLMTQHGLEYPNFYEKLYALLVPSIFMAKHRAKFLQLLDSCLKSPLLPAYLAAAFTKKLSRLALSVPPSGALVITALIHNLLRRHPSINFLVHREDGIEVAKDDAENSDVTSTAGLKFGVDHFKDEESDPKKSNAMRSSLWEIDTLRHHCCPPVSRFVLSLENDLTVRFKTTEVTVSDFASGSYATIHADEMRRRIKQVPVAFYKETPTALFSEIEFPGWTFKSEDGKEPNASASEEHDRNSAKRQRVECS